MATNDNYMVGPLEPTTTMYDCISRTFELFRIPYSEWTKNSVLKKLAERNSMQPSDVYSKAFNDFCNNINISTDTDEAKNALFILTDNGQNYSCNMFLKFPESDCFVQYYSSAVSGCFFGEEREAKGAIKWIDEKAASKYNRYYYTYNSLDVFYRNYDICIASAQGGFAIGRLVKTFYNPEYLTGIRFNMLKGYMKPYRYCKCTLTNEYICLTINTITNEEKIHIWKDTDGEKNYRCCEVSNCIFYRDGGSTDITYNDNGIEYKLHITTSWESNPVHTLNNLPCIDELSPSDLTEMLHSFYEASGTRMLKD